MHILPGVHVFAPDLCSTGSLHNWSSRSSCQG
jgi:hypothetical protein